MTTQEIRWQQRFQNFEKSFSYLEQAIDIEDPEVIQRAGLIQFFEMTFELAWKMLKDYLERQGFLEVNSPRAVLKKAFEIGLISDGHQWLQCLQDRNLTSHTYNEEIAIEIEATIRQTYYPLLHQLHRTFKELANE
jgi:nucleotidyltransferase substrate binding protein (TIGR01987 family)